MIMINNIRGHMEMIELGFGSKRRTSEVGVSGHSPTLPDLEVNIFVG
jgi:hypothetical protein